ncbi:MAG: hypothetical protein IBX68_12880, partial [Dehalococcoidia bacterium]|nr:hypothetical protein [Dehalococcoidia bacterium]
MLRVVGIALLVLLVLAGIAAGLGAYGYSSLDATFEMTSLEPKYAGNTGSILSALWQAYISGRPISEILEGLTIAGTVHIHNNSFVPVWIPESDHRVYLGDKAVGDTVHTPAMGLSVREVKTVDISMTIPADDLPDIALEYILSGGKIEVSVESTFEIASFTFSRTS